MGSWELSFDTEQWKEQQLLHLFFQPVPQISGDQNEWDVTTSMVKVLEVGLNYLN